MTRVMRARRRVDTLLGMLADYERRPDGALLVSAVQRGLRDASRELADAVFSLSHASTPRLQRSRAKWEVSADAA